MNSFITNSVKEKLAQKL
ncbi:hypothetical protein Nmel_003541 [Mimus melanotis]